MGGADAFRADGPPAAADGGVVVRGHLVDDQGTVPATVTWKASADGLAASVEVPGATEVGLAADFRARARRGRPRDPRADGRGEGVAGARCPGRRREARAPRRSAQPGGAESAARRSSRSTWPATARRAPRPPRRPTAASCASSFRRGGVRVVPDRDRLRPGAAAGRGRPPAGARARPAHAGRRAHGPRRGRAALPVRRGGRGARPRGRAEARRAGRSGRGRPRRRGRALHGVRRRAGARRGGAPRRGARGPVPARPRRRRGSSTSRRRPPSCAPCARGSTWRARRPR